MYKGSSLFKGGKPTSEQLCPDTVERFPRFRFETLVHTTGVDCNQTFSFTGYTANLCNAFGEISYESKQKVC